MASTKRHKGMVFHQEGATTPAAPPAWDHPPTRFVVPKPGKASEGGMEQSARVTNEEVDMVGKPNMYPPKEAMRTSGKTSTTVKHPASSNPPSDNLSPDSICKGIRVTLDNNGMWNEFFKCKTEMILTKQGSRMFPYCRFRISGLQPSRKYSLIMDIQPLDNSRYKWTGKNWQVAGKAECNVKSRPFAHPESPSTGQHWMQNPVSFYKLKLTNNITDQDGNTILHPMHRYLPRLHLAQTDKAAEDVKLNGPSVVTFTFPQTEFMAVTAYQNSQFSQLKVDYNPFAKGLKEDGSSSRGLKLNFNSGKDNHKDGGATSNEQYALKKSLKSLLANHKPRSSKAVDSKPSVSGDLQKNSTTNKDPSAAKVAEEHSCNSLPAPTKKLFSELIREAHVSLQRCNLEQLGINNSTSYRTAQTNTKTTAFMTNGQDLSKRDSKSVKTQSETSPGKKVQTLVTRRKVKTDKDLLNPMNSKDNVGTDCSEANNVTAPVSQKSSVDERKSEGHSEVEVKQHKRPAPLPLPALALFLKQHSTKSKKAKSKPDSPSPALLSESLSESDNSAAASTCATFDPTVSASGPSKNITESDNQASRHLHPHEVVSNVTEQVVKTHQPSSLSCQDAVATTVPKGPRTEDFVASISVAESTEPVVPDDAPVLPNLDQSFCTLGTSISTISTLATSSPSSVLSPPLDTVSSAPNSPHTPTIAESSTQPSDSPTTKSESLLSDPECSSFGYEPLSPASSPEPLPSIPALITLQLDSTTCEPTPNAVSPEELTNSEDSTASVFKWHTVLPPPEPYIGTTFTTFQPTSQTLPLLPSQTPTLPEPQTFDTSTSLPDPAPSFQENEQSLPFPAELSPLALQLPLSPTFSSLDGDGLSPTPSIAELVHFFSTDDDLSMGVDFSNTETMAIPCPPPSAVEANAHEISQQVQPIPDTKPCKHRKKSRREKLAKTNTDQKMNDSAYTSMQPNLEEVEEQLFISFTSKEALKLHVVDSTEETVSQPQTTPEHLQQTTDAPENDKSMDVGESSLPDRIHPNNFPAKLWRLVNNPDNKAICWDSQGKVIIIDRHLFEAQSLSPSTVTADNAEAFKATNFSSFVRQLNLYGFKKADPAIHDDHHPAGYSGAYYNFYNPNFKRNHPELVATLRRLTVVNKAKLQAGLSVNCRHSSRYQRFSDDGREVKKVETAESQEEKISAFEKILLRDLKLMRHRQVIHPVLQEVGLKMNLLDTTLAIDLQYLGVRLPIPPPGVSVEPLTQELPPPQGVCAAFVSRTGKTTDVTQIKGWREKFSPSETLVTLPPPRPEAGPGPDLPKKNLSAFCSDMLDQYLENEGKLIDQRAASFSPPPVEPPVYELPTRSTSYVRTLDSILKKQTGTSDLISGFVPPSKRPKPTLKETRTSRRESSKQRGPKHYKPEPAAGPSQADSNFVPKQPAVQIPDSPQPPTFKKRKKLKPRSLSQTLSPHRSTSPPPGLSEDLAPLESDSELGTALDQNYETSRKDGGPVMTRTLLKQKDLEDGVVWEGRPRTSITDERAAIALTSLFTLQGFVSENPTAPIQLIRRRVPPCLNEFCRLGCVCSSLSQSVRTSHCGRPPCMLGCSCLKQKVVLLKNLEGSDSSPSPHGTSRKRKRKRRMKMAYILKEADSVSQPAEQVRTLWKRDQTDLDQDPIHVPKVPSLPRPSEKGEGHSSCARVRGYRGKKKIQKESPTDVKSKDAQLKPVKQRNLKLKETKSRPSGLPTVGEPVQSSPSNRPPTPPAEPPPKPSKRLIIMAECQWACEADQSLVLKELCERMAWDRLDQPFWIKKYLISPMGQTVEESGPNSCIQYKIHISRPKLEREKPAAPMKPAQRAKQRERKLQQQEVRGVEPVEDWQQEVEEEEPVENWQREVEEEEAAPPEDWQREVEEGDIEEEAGSTVHQVHDGRKSGREELKLRSEEKKKMASMALPFLTGVSPAGFLSANRKQPGGTDHTVQVNGKLYPLAKIQLGKMGALHPANRLAAYLTGRVGSNWRKQGSSSSSKPPQSSGPTPQTVSLTSSPPRSQPLVAVLTPPSSSTDPQVSVVPPVNPASKGSLFIVQVPGLRGKVPVPGPAPGPAPGHCPAPPIGQRMVLQPVQAASGVQYYRRPDGKLVQLVPISQLRSVNQNQSVHRGSSSLSVLPAASCQTSVGKIVNQTPPVTTVSSSSSTSSSSLSGFRSFSVSPLSSPLCPYSSVLAQKGTCTFKILPPNSSKEPIIVTCAKVPPRPFSEVAPGSFTLLRPAPTQTQMNLISLKPSSGRGVELGVKTVTVSAGPGGVLVNQKPPLAPPGSEVTPQPNPPEPELAHNPVNLDVISVDKETELVTTETAGGAKNSLDTVEQEEQTEGEMPVEREEPTEGEMPVEREEPTEGEMLVEREDPTKEEMLGEMPVEREEPTEGEMPVEREEPTEVEMPVEREEPTEVEMPVEREEPTEVEREWPAGSDTENSSDFGEETDSEEQSSTNNDSERQRHNHNATEKRRRGEMRQLFERLRTEVGLSDDKASKISTLRMAVVVIEELRMFEAYLKKKKKKLTKRRDQYLSTIAPTTEESRQVSSPESDTELPERRETDELTGDSSDEERLVAKTTNIRKDHLKTGPTSQRPGKGEQRLRKMQHLSSNQRKRLPAGGEASEPSSGDTTDDDIMITSSKLKQQAPPTALSAPPTSTPVRTNSKPSLAPPGVSHNASLLRGRPRTVPNILSRSKNPAKPSSLLTKNAEEAASFLLPAEILSLVRAALPGQPVLTLGPMMGGPTMLQTSPTPGVASVTLNIPSLTNQIHLTSLHHHPTGKIYSSSTVTNFTDFNNLLQLVQPSTTPQQPQQQKQQAQAQAPQQDVPPPPAVVSAGPDQDQAPSQSTSPSAFSTQGPGSSLQAGVPEQEGTTEDLDVPVGGHLKPEQQEGSREDLDQQSLTSLLNEIVFLNQQAAALQLPGQPPSEAGQPEEGPPDSGPGHSPWLLQLDSDSDDTVNTETEESGPQPRPANGDSTAGVLAPPPLLQMKVGGSTVASPARSASPAVEGGGRGGRAGRREGGVTWRPMPRLVPLGLRGNPPC
uniref:MAX gene-associated protein n=1 Tax=Dicentrarchus labrax TaxID=13489 RepID=A0A8P4G9F9_DICLA